MSTNRPFVLTIAGFDPSGGAGILADCKTFEQHRVYGLAITTANTLQTENEFIEIKWTDLSFVLKSIEKLFATYDIKVVKIGIVPSLDYLKQIIFCVKGLSSPTKIVWDTVLKSTTEFEFLDIENQTMLIKILEKMDLITPNYDEIKQLLFHGNNPDTTALLLSKYCPVLLKGGHNPNKIGFDYLYLANECFNLAPTSIEFFDKHGSGCVLSSAIAANLALEQDLKTACMNAKKYIERYLQSNTSKLGNHYVP